MKYKFAIVEYDVGKMLRVEKILPPCRDTADGIRRNPKIPSKIHYAWLSQYNGNETETIRISYTTRVRFSFRRYFISK